MYRQMYQKIENFEKISDNYFKIMKTSENVQNFFHKKLTIISKKELTNF